jgi:hypothetical protein
MKRHHILYGLILFMSISMAFIMYRVFVPKVVLEVKELPIRVVGLTYGTTRAVIYRFNYCKFYNFPSTVNRELHLIGHEFIVGLPTVGYSFPVGCGVVDIAEPLPSYIPPGVYRLRITYQYQGNAVTKPHIFETETFELK